MKRWIGFVLVTFLLCSCRDKTLNIGNKNIFDIQKDISYGEDAEQKMDLYLPQNHDTLKGIFVIIHGGGWKSGDKSQLMTFVISLMKKFPDYGFANLNYRLASNLRFAIPNQTDDIDLALDFVTKQLTKTTNKKPFILLGNSAGAHLSMLYGYNSFFNLKNNKKVKAIVNIVGPSDLHHNDFKNYIDYDFVRRQIIDENLPAPNHMANRDIPNPVFWITEKSPPTLSYYGSRDTVIPISQKAILDSSLSKNNVYHESYEFSGGHLDWARKKESSFLINKIENFLTTVDQKTP